MDLLGSGPVAIDVPIDVPIDVLDDLRERLSHCPGDLTPQRVAETLRATGRPVGDAMVLSVYEALRRDVVGAGPLDPLLRTPGVSDVLVNGPNEVYLDRGRGLEPVDVRFRDDAAVRRLGQRLAAQAGRRLDDATPYVDARLPDGVRLHVVLAPLSRPGTALSLRVPHRIGFDLADLVTGDVLETLRSLVSSRRAFLVSGGTGSGKTTLLAALLSEVDTRERLVLVEDSSELRPTHPHVVGLEARPANIEGAGEITVRTLVRQALRMRPDRLVVGEVRGGEVVELLAALNTGHEGGCGTLHANSASDVPARIEALALAAGLGREAVHAQLGAALDVVLHVVRGSDGSRRLAQVGVVERDAQGWVGVVPALEIDPDGAPRRGVGAGRLLRLLEGTHG